MVDLEEMIKAQQIKMIKRLLANENLLWKPTMEVIIGILNLDLFLRSNFPIQKIHQTFTQQYLNLGKNLSMKLSTVKKIY